MCEQIFFNTKETANILGVPVATLRSWKEPSTTPLGYPRPFLPPWRIGSRLYYTRQDIDTFVNEVCGSDPNLKWKVGRF